MRILKGIAAGSGIGSGKAFLYLHEKLVIPYTLIEESSVHSETERFEKALELAEKDLIHLLPLKQQTDQKSILEAHLLMLRDPEFIQAVTMTIANEHKCAEWAVEATTSRLLKELAQFEDSSLRERSSDIYEVSWRIIRYLLGKQRANLGALEEEVVLVGDTLLPVEALTINPDKVKAIVLDEGGRTSHVAILARALRIPTVVGLGNITKKIKNGEQIIVDGNRGEVSLRPTSSSAEQFELRYQRWLEREKSLQSLLTLDAVTTDGHSVALRANVETPRELTDVMAHGGQGVGLFRSEFLFMKPGGASEEEQFQVYRQILEFFGHEQPVTIRTIDVGGDKAIGGVDTLHEENPILGWRAIRFSLARKDIFRTQLRALLRASVYGKLKIMFPMISGVEELEAALAVLDQVKTEALQKGVAFDPNLEVGTMIEVPSAALCAASLAQKVDFFSIGTNDLIQYTIAVDRGNEKIAYLYQPFHPAVLRLIAEVIKQGHQANIPVGLCGEMAADPEATALLLGLGLDEFSMSSQGLLEIKKIIRSISLTEAQEMARNVMELSSYQKIGTYIKEWMHERFDNQT